MFEKTDYRMITYNILLASFALNVVYGICFTGRVNFTSGSFITEILDKQAP